MKFAMKILRKILGLRKILSKISASAAALLLLSVPAFAAVGCDLNDPDRDVRRFFPESTGYKTEYVSVAKTGGNALYEKLQARLGDSFSGIFEKIDVPYTVYTVLKEDVPVGYIHGVNQKGKFGGMQVFLILDPAGTIRNFYFQKLTSRGARALRSREFGAQFVGLSLADFAEYDVPARRAPAGTRVAEIKNPAPESEEDFYAALRGTKKNLLLMDAFIFNPAKENGRQ